MKNLIASVACVLIISIAASSCFSAAEDPTDQYTESEYKALCSPISYEEISRDKNALQGERFTFTGEIVQMIEQAGYSTIQFRLDVTKDEYGFYSDTIYVDYEIKDGEKRFIENDIVTIWGISAGLYSYETIMKSTVTIPRVRAKYVELAND